MQLYFYSKKKLENNDFLTFSNIHLSRIIYHPISNGKNAINGARTVFLSSIADDNNSSEC